MSALIPQPDGTLITPDKGAVLDLPEETWCLGCEALDPKPWRFTRDQAEQMGEWVLCADCLDTFHGLSE